VKKFLISCFVFFLSQNVASAADEWEYSATFYGWFPGVSNTVSTPLGEVEAEVDFFDILEHLELGYFGAVEGRKGRWSLIGDLQYLNLGAEAEGPKGLLFSSVEADTKIVAFTGYGTYALIDNTGYSIDIGGGFRYVKATLDTQFVGQGAVSDRSFSSETNWVDGVLAARMTLELGERLTGVAFVDVGGFGIGESSDLTWQAAAGMEYQINESWSAVGGYRHLAIERSSKDVEFTVNVSGPYLGFRRSF
jgi:opacity protein-like surface antigen